MLDLASDNLQENGQRCEGWLNPPAAHALDRKYWCGGGAAQREDSRVMVAVDGLRTAFGCDADVVEQCASPVLFIDG